MTPERRRYIDVRLTRLRQKLLWLNASMEEKIFVPAHVQKARASTVTAIKRWEKILSTSTVDDRKYPCLAIDPDPEFHIQLLKGTPSWQREL